MSMFVKRVLGFALFGAIAGAGVMQAGQQATFHLPFAATWGNAVLPPGDYRVSLPMLSVGPREFYLTGQGTRVLIPPMSTDVDSLRATHLDHSYLRLVNVDGVYYVENYESGPTGIEFSFKVPKQKHRVQMSKQEVVRLDASGE
jgi:hypothetical protein